MMKYCDACGKETEAKIISRPETFKVCGEDITVEARVLVCTECGEDLFCEELDSAALVNAYNGYRRKHKLLLPDEIRQIREKYGLSQRSFAKLLNWGDKTICRYENGSVQDKAHNSLLLFLREPMNMRTYLTENETALGEKQKAKLLDTIEKLEHDTEYRAGSRFFELYFSGIPCEENGFKGILSDNEIDVLERIYDKLKDFGSVDISNYSHREKGHIDTKQGEIISYSYAKDIQLN